MNVHTKWNGLIPILSSLVQYLAILGMNLLVRSNQYIQVVISQPHLDCFWNTDSKMKTNIRLLTYTPNGTAWYLFCLGLAILGMNLLEVTYTYKW